jgi:hypothetical protein
MIPHDTRLTSPVLGPSLFQILSAVGEDRLSNNGSPPGSSEAIMTFRSPLPLGLRPLFQGSWSLFIRISLFIARASSSSVSATAPNSSLTLSFIDPNYVGTPYNVTWARGSDSDPTEFYIESFIISQQVPIASSDKVLVQTNGATQGTVTFLQCNDQCVCPCVLSPKRR